jgi:hypothetical protein
MEFQNLTLKIVKILEELKIPYAITGGYAVSIWGRIRSTLDIDIVVDLFEEKTQNLVSALKSFSKFGYVDISQIQDALRRKSEFNFIHESGIKVDFWIKSGELFAKQELKRRRAKIIGGKKIYFVSPEDLILSKLIWHKKTGSDYQLKDVESIIRRQKKLDWKYIKRWAAIQSTLKILGSLEK